MKRLVLAFCLALFAPAQAAGQPSGLSQALGAAFQEYLREGDEYSRLYARYVGIPPRHLPRTLPVAWPSRVDGSPLDRVLRNGVLRLGWCENPPYQFRDGRGRHTGLDHDLAGRLAARIAWHYGIPGLEIAWVESRLEAPPGREQEAMHRVLIAALKRNEIDAAMSGLLALPADIVGETVARACANHVLFTNVFYTGRDRLGLEGVGDRGSLVRHLAAQPLEFSFLAVRNRGPSFPAANALAAEVRGAGGRATSRGGTIPEVVKALRDGSVHFVIGDSNSLGYWASQPGFPGRNLDLPVGEGTLDLAPFTLPGGYGASELSEVVSAAFREFADAPGRYAGLYEKYTGFRREAPDNGTAGRWIHPAAVTPQSTLDRVLRAGRLRIGFQRHPPFFYTEGGRDTGFEWELGNAMGAILAGRYPGLAVEWVELDIDPGGGGRQNLVLYDAIESALLDGRIDVAMSGLMIKPDRPVAVAAPTMRLFMTAVYTGKGGWDLRALQSAGREQFIRFMAEHPGCTIISTPGGPSEETARELVAEVAALGGAASNFTATVGDLIRAVASGSHHFVVGDGLALSNLATRPGFKGLNLNLSLRLPEEWLAPMTALDP